jgi:choice-of-anchor B domain-containing protein
MHHRLAAPSRPAALVLLGALLGGALAVPAGAHEDDPKLLDRRPHLPGPGRTTAVPPPGTRLAASSGPEFPSDGVTLLAWLSLDDFGAGATSGNDCWGYTSPSGREYALMGLSTGTAFVEVTTPSAPQIVSFQSGPSSTWRDIKVWSHYVYAVSEGGSGIQVFDVQAIDSGQVGYLGTVTTGGDTTTHNVAIDETSGFLYRCGGGDNGLRIYDLNASPTAPQLVGSWSSKYVHDAQVVTYASGPLAGRQIAFCCSGFNGGFTNTGLSIVDVTNKAAPTVLDEVFWPGAQYSHQVWLSPDLRYAYLNDELDEDGTLPTTTYVIDVVDPADALLVGSFTNGNGSVGHNLYTRDERIFEANYRSGLRVFDASADPTQPVEVAWFDTWPEDDDDAFNGLWSCYPYFDSGIVLGSDIEKGLFVWWVGAPLLDLQPLGPPPALLEPDGDQVEFTITEAQAGALVPGTTKLHYDAGAGLVSADLAYLGGTSWRADFPALPCGAQVGWFVSAESTNGITWSWPEGGSSAPAQATVAFGETIALSDDLESASGWTVGAAGDDATTGVWVRVDPIGTGAQPEDDHTAAPGVTAWVTGQGPLGGSVGDNDVDGGTTTLVSPALDLSGLADPIVRYWRWYSNGSNGVQDDVLVVQVSNGGAWVTVETLGPTGPETAGGWFQHAFRVADLVQPGASVRLRFRAADVGQGSIVEAAVDDLEALELDCSGGAPVAYCTAKLNSQGCVPQVGFSGLPSASGSGPFVITTADVVAKQNGILFYGSGRAAVPFQGATLCVASPITRMPPQNAGGSQPCSGSFAYDFQARITGGADPSLVAGAQVNAQFWYRDSAASFGSGLSDALEFTILP